MSWEGAPAYRWVKMFKGVRYRVTCQELGAMVWTKEATAKAANEWWRKKLAELTGPTPLERVVTNLGQVAQDRAEAAKVTTAVLAGGGNPGRILLEYLLQSGGTPEEMTRACEAIPRDEQGQLEALGKLQEALGTAPVPADFSVATQAELFLDVVRLSIRKPGTFGDLAYYVRGKIQTFLGANTDVRAINEDTVERFYKELRKAGSPSVQFKVWAHFKRFLTYLWSKGRIELPRNLKLLKLSVPAKKIRTYPLEQVREVVKGLPDRLRLYAMLALNCGMLSVDMAKLKVGEYQNGRIRRKRTKTEDQKDVPEVDYLLWPETVELLAKYPPKGEYVLTSKKGTPLWSRKDNGKTARTDLIGQQWRKARVPIPLKALRSVGATILESHPQYGRYKVHYLGQSPRTIADRNYAAPSKELFDKIILWLRGQTLGK
jgi:integrase